MSRAITASEDSTALLARDGRYPPILTAEQLHRYFRFDDHDRAVLAQKKGKHNRLGYALQLATVRFLGTFLTDPLDMPEAAIQYVAQQLDLTVNPVKLDRYRTRETRWDHRHDIQARWGYRDFSDIPAFFDLARFLSARARLMAEPPSRLLDLSTARLVERRVLLPGVTTLTRLIARIQHRADERLWRDLAALPSEAQVTALEALLDVPPRSSVSRLDRLRKAPLSVSATGLVGALKRVEAVRRAGVTTLDLSGFPEQRRNTLFRIGMGVKAQALRRMTRSRRIATLLVTVSRLEGQALDDALTLFESLLTDLFNRIERKEDGTRQDHLPSLEEAARRSNQLTLAFLESLGQPPQDFPTFAARVLALVPQEQLQAAAETVQALTRPRSETRLEGLLSRYSYVQQFLPALLRAVTFEGSAAGAPSLAALQALRRLERRSQVMATEVPLTLVKGDWSKLIPGKGPLNRPAFTLCVLDHLHLALKRRDVFVPASPKFSDPRLHLLSDQAWTALRAEVCRSLDLDLDPQVMLAQFSAQLDERYQLVEARLPQNAAVSLAEEEGRTVLVLQEDEALPEPLSLRHLRELVARRMPRLDLPDLLLEVHRWTGFAHAFTHLSEARTRVDHLDVSVCAVLLAEACNVGLDAVVQAETESLGRGRLSWVDQHYLRAETIASANARLIEFQTTIPTVAAWGDGQVASVDGLRFRVPVKTIYAGQNPKYFGVRSGVTYVNFISDQYSGFHGIVVPGTLRDSLFALDGMIEQNTVLRPQQLVPDTAASSYMVFGLFRLLGYQFSPELADLRERTYARMSRKAQYGKLNALATSQVSTALIATHWDDLLRLAGSLMTRTVRASDLLKVIGVKPKSALTRALEQVGRIASTLHLLSYHDDLLYRRTIGTQRNRQEARHRLTRAVFQGRHGELRQHYVAGMEDQLGALGLVVNAIILWNARYLDLILNQLRAEGMEVRDEDVQRLSPLKFEHIHLGGRYHFSLTSQMPAGQFRRLRDRDEVES